jgi:hypothetical protein
MYRLYEDLRDKLGEPKWHDEQGVPRYCDYHPSCGDIYDRWAALLEIECQGCRQRFLVSDSYSPMDFIRAGWKPGDPTEPAFPAPDNYGGSFSFGDAPWHGARQCSGTTMTTDTTRVVEFWTRDGGDHAMEWQRRPEYEFTYPAPSVNDDAYDLTVP